MNTEFQQRLIHFLGGPARTIRPHRDWHHAKSDQKNARRTMPTPRRESPDARAGDDR